MSDNASREARRIVFEVLREHAAAGCPHAAAELEHRRRQRIDGYAAAGALLGRAYRTTAERLAEAVAPVLAFSRGAAEAMGRDLTRIDDACRGARAAAVADLARLAPPSDRGDQA